MNLLVKSSCYLFLEHWATLSSVNVKIIIQDGFKLLHEKSTGNGKIDNTI